MKKALRRFIIQDLLSKNNCDTFSDDCNLLEAGLDSLGMMRLVDFIEVEYKIELSDVDVVPANMKTIDAIDGLINRYLNVRC